MTCETGEVGKLYHFPTYILYMLYYMTMYVFFIIQLYALSTDTFYMCTLSYEYDYDKHIII